MWLTKLTSHRLAKWMLLILIVGAGVMLNRQVQSYLGIQAFEQTGLPDLPLAEAISAASENDKLVLVNMSAIWCPTCRKLDQKVFSSEQVKQAIAGNYEFSRIEFDSSQGRSFMGTYKVRGFPTLLVLNGQGERLALLPLTFEPAEFAANLETVRRKF